ncbi:MAG: DUF4340 domain-containing protein [Byssovorax sp.]
MKLAKHATTLALTALALAAGVGVLVLDRDRVTTTEAETRKKNLFEAYRPDDITELSLRADGKTARLFRGAPNDAGQRPWQVEIDGARYPAEERAADQLVSALEMGTAERWVANDAVDAHGFGLDPGQIAVEIVMGRLTLRLRVGGPAPTPEGSHYAEIEGRGVAVITRELAAALDADPATLRARALLPYPEGDVVDLQILEQGGPTRRFTRIEAAGRGRGARFLLDAPAPQGSSRVAAAAMEKIWSTLGALDADVYLDQAAGEKALARRVTVQLTLRDPTTPRAAIELGGPCPGHPDDVVAVRTEPDRAAACVAAGLVDDLLVAPGALADPHLVGATTDQVTEVKIEAPGRTVELARQGPQWHLRSPEDRSVDADAGHAFLDALLAVEGDRFAPRDLQGAPRSTIRVISLVPTASADGGDAERVETLEIFPEQAGLIPVRRVEDGAVLLVPKNEASPLLPDVAALRSRKVFDEPLASIRSFRVEAGARVQRFTRDTGGGFTLQEPHGEGLVADGALASEVAAALGSLSVDRWIGADSGAYGLEKPRLILEAQLDSDHDAGPPRAIRVALGAPAGAGSFARAGDDPAVFIAPAALEEMASRWLLDRTTTAVAPETIRRATLTGEGGKHLIIEKVGDALRIAGVPADPVSSARAASIRDALADLTAEAAVSVGPPEKAQGLDKPRLDIQIERAGVGTHDTVPPVHLRFGAEDTLHGTRVVYVRREGVAATWAVAQGKARALFDALDGK